MTTVEPLGPRIICVAGHSKWAQIKRKKGAADAKRGQLFTKLARAITVAARDGGGDPDGNAALANAIEKAKSLRMPKENIERAIARGTGAGGDAAAIEAVSYEGYGPGGVAILVECLTDNRNRTAAEIRHIFAPRRRAPRRAGLGGVDVREEGRPAGRGAPLQRGRRDARDRRRRRGRRRRGRLDPDRTEAGRPARGQRGAGAGRTWRSSRPSRRCCPRRRSRSGADDARKLLRLLDALDEQDDVDQVHANFDITADVMEEVAA